MRIGDTVYLAHSPGNQLPFVNPYEATITFVSEKHGYCGVTTTRFTIPQIYPNRDIFPTREEAVSRIRSMCHYAIRSGEQWLENNREVSA